MDPDQLKKIDTLVMKPGLLSPVVIAGLPIMGDQASATSEQPDGVQGGNDLPLLQFC